MNKSNEDMYQDQVDAAKAELERQRSVLEVGTNAYITVDEALKCWDKVEREEIQEAIDKIESEMREIRLKFINEMVPLFGK